MFQGDQIEEFKAHILGVLHNSIGPRRDLILARLEGGPLANTGVIAGMSGSPVYIDGRLVGAVSYSLGQFSKEPLAGITPIDEMIADATLPGQRRRRSHAPSSRCRSRRKAFASRCGRRSPGLGRSPTARPTSVIGDGAGERGHRDTLLRPIATPINSAGSTRARSILLSSAFRDLGFAPVMAGAAQLGSTVVGRVGTVELVDVRLRPGDPIGVALMNGDLEVGATGTVTEVDGNRVYAFGHPFFGLGPTQFPMTRAHVIAVLPSLARLDEDRQHR